MESIYRKSWSLKITGRVALCLNCKYVFDSKVLTMYYPISQRYRYTVIGNEFIFSSLNVICNQII